MLHATEQMAVHRDGSLFAQYIFISAKPGVTYLNTHFTACNLA